MKKKFAGIAFVLLSIAIMSVSAYVYEQGTLTVNQKVVDVVTLNLRTPLGLADLEEGQVGTYNEAGVITLETKKANVVLRLDSNIEGFAASSSASPYAAYSIVVSYSGGSVTLTPSSPDATFALGSPQLYTFDLAITATAKSGLGSDVPTGATIVVTAESP